MKRRGLYILIVIISISLYVFSSSVNYGDNFNRIIKDVPGSSWVEVEGRAVFNTNLSEIEVIDEILSSFGVNYYSCILEGENYKGSFKHNGDKGTIVLRKLDDERTFVSLVLSQEITKWNINNIWLGMMRAFNSFKARPEFYFTAKGEIDNLSCDLEGFAKGLVEAWGGKVNSVFNDGNILSLTGFIPGLNKGIGIGKNSVNINIAMRRTGNTTCIYVGSPIITIEY